MNNTRDEELIQKLSQLAQSYTPQWRFTTENPDPGSVVGILFSEMLSESRRRYDRVLHKHKIQYLNLFDRLKEEPIESARTYVKFNPVSGMEEPVNIPKGTQLTAEVEDVAGQITFETAYSISAIDSQVKTIIATDKELDYIAHLVPDGSDAEKTPFVAFDLSKDSNSEHMMLLGFESLFDDITNPELLLRLGGASRDDATQAVLKFLDADIEIGMLTEEEFIKFDKCEARQDCIYLQKEDYAPLKTERFGKKMYFIAVKSKSVPEFKFNGLSAIQSKNELPAEEIYCGGVLQNPEHFYPFGLPMEIYAECGIENKEVFARKGADVKLSFKLSFEDMEQTLPEYEQDEELKIIMRKQKQSAQLAKVEVKPDYVLLEYYSKTGWKRLIKDEQAALLFNGSIKGETGLEFKIPEDMIDSDEYTDNYRMRLRLMRADNLYRVPCVMHIPIVDALRFEYDYNDNYIKPDCAYTINNYNEDNVSELVKDERSVRPFYNSELLKPTMYFGFETPFWGTPVSMYFDIENHEDFPVDFTVQYFSDSGFEDLKVIDNTKGMRYSETILMMIPSDIMETKLFGEKKYWIRFISHNPRNTDANLPTIKGIYTNMVQVQNKRTDTEYFHVDDIDTAVKIQLSAVDIIHANVYVNELSTDGKEDNWVRWKKSTFVGEQGRIYGFDATTGEIRFDKGIFAKYQISEDADAIKVEYQSYHGAKANVDKGMISTLTNSIKFISSVTNPMSAYGGYDGYNEKTSTSVISNMLRTRGRAVSEDDYFDIISQISYGVRRIKCRNGIDQYGDEKENNITIAVLIEEYNKGGHIFSSIKDRIRDKLLESSSILPMGKTLILSQPYFVRLSLRLWMECDRMENAYDLQKSTSELISKFIDPLNGGFEGQGWEIGVLPTVQQILAYLKIKQPEIAVTRTVLTANFGKNEFAVNDEIYQKINNPFAMAVNGEHIIYAQLNPKV